MKAFVNIGCNGRMQKGLIMCPGTLNKVADLRRVTVEQEHIIDYLEKHYKLFDAHAVDLNKIGNIINLLAREGIIISQKEEALYDYLAMHKKCGLYLYIDPLDPELEGYSVPE